MPSPNLAARSWASPAPSGVTAGTFEFIEHTADVGLRLSARTPAELFLAGASGLHALWGIPPPPASAAPPAESVTVTGPDTEALLVAWLNELIFQATAQGRYAAAISAPRLEEDRFTAAVAWRPLEWATCVDGTDIKAATFHTVQIHAMSGGVTTTIIFDV